MRIFGIDPGSVRTGYGRAEKTQIQQMVMLLLGLDAAPKPHDAADAVAIAICHAHASGGLQSPVAGRAPRHLRSWRHAKISDITGRPVS